MASTGTYRLRVLGDFRLSAIHDGGEQRVDVQPKPLALLAFLAVVSRGRPVRRDVLLALFWPELPTDRARAALRQAIFHLRFAVGDELVPALPDDAVMLATDACWCDVVEFDRALDRGDAAAAVELYAGPLFEGVYVKGVAAELEERFGVERARLERAAVRAASTLARDAEARGDTAAADHWARRALDIAPDAEDLRALVNRLSAQAQAFVATSPSIRALPVRSTIPEPPAVSFAAASSTPIGSEPGPAVKRWLARPLFRALRTAGLAMSVLALALVLGSATKLIPRIEGAVGGGRAIPAADATVRKAVFTRLYDEGMDRLDASQNREATRLFESALRDDSACAVCALRAAQSVAYIDATEMRRLFRKAMAMTEHGPEYERLLTRFWWQTTTSDPRQAAMADSLAIRFPEYGEAQVASIWVLISSGLPLEAVARARRITAADRDDALASGRTRSPASDAWSLAVSALENADSTAAAAREAREWTRRHPNSETAWITLADALGRAARYTEAREALTSFAGHSSSSSSSPDDTGLLEQQAIIDIRQGRYDSAAALLRPLERVTHSATRHDALWWHAIALRNQGRQREALQLVRGPMRGIDESGAGSSFTAGLLEGQLLFELGRFADAALLFREVAAHPEAADAGLESVIARKRAWSLTHAGTALATAGDTASLSALIDTVAVTGAHSSFARDPRLHHYLRGLLWCLRDQPDSAEVSLRASLTSHSEGFTRENAELAALLIGQHRSLEALPLLTLALQGPVEASNNYITRTELHALLAEAFADAGRADSAAVEHGMVRRAWGDRRAWSPIPLVCRRRTPPARPG